MNEKDLIFIIERILKELEEHRDTPKDKLYVNDKERTLTYDSTMANEKGFMEIRKDWSYGYIEKWIKGKELILLYACKDNQLISIENENGIDNEYKDMIDTIIENKFYIAYDWF